MDRHKAIILAVAVLAGGTVGVRPAAAQTFQNYHCADGTNFIVGFYDYDKRAFVQIDGASLPLKKRVTLSGARYSGAGITLKIGKAGTTMQHLKRPVTACALVERT
ncbi:MliC family protein [Bradyrhizobium manausense]|uniref:MliC family protein n=1 Tax=Bradyrhizobium TaxID=374 RepID=UPI001BA51C61|nr:MULTISPECIES: MliC family protein [Bradyrhizobium]MBR0828061.1 MliC family protein [Bradyrhizobium manausense]UVO32923.1 MliC family protein [Bradyrhizobium arachidis]